MVIRKDVDNYRSAFVDGKQWLADLESKEKKVQVLKTLKLNSIKSLDILLK